MRYEVRRDAPLCLDSGATSLAVGFNFAILTFKDNIKIIQNRHFRHRRHQSTVPPLQIVINLRRFIASPHERGPACLPTNPLIRKKLK